MESTSEGDDFGVSSDEKQDNKKIAKETKELKQEIKTEEQKSDTQ